MKPVEFEKLLKATKTAFNNSDIKAYAHEHQKIWNYAITATPLKPHKLLLIGFNWGASEGVAYKPQDTLSEINFMEMDNKDLGSFNRLKPWLREFCGQDLQDMGQSNFCFFRSGKDGQISAADLKLSTPLFERLLKVASPKEILGFSSRLRDHLVASDHFEVFRETEIPFERGGKDYCCKVLKGVYHVEGKEVPVSLLPHPNSPLRRAVRQKAWAFCFGG